MPSPRGARTGSTLQSTSLPTPEPATPTRPAGCSGPSTSGPGQSRCRPARSSGRRATHDQRGARVHPSHRRPSRPDPRMHTAPLRRGLTPGRKPARTDTRRLHRLRRAIRRLPRLRRPLLLQDLVSPDCAEVRLLHLRGGFDAPLPRKVAAYLSYRDSTVEFVQARNARMSRWVAAADHTTYDAV